ncbi:MAG: GerMN domain-containing protein [Desulfosporosinus sp.]|nr:GerMN domain-containing protein [Desulfosporosinus sp.]
MKLQVRNSLITGVVILGLIFLAGCGTLETLVNKDGTGTSLGDFIGGDKTTLPAVAPATTETPAATGTESMTIALYFADSTGRYLVKEQRSLPKTVSLARETVTQWLKGPAGIKGTTLQAAVPTTTMLLDIAIKGNVAIVDLNKEFLQPNPKVSPEVALYGLVDTLTQFSTIKQVQIRIEGNPMTKYGTIDATRLVNKASLIKGVASTNQIVPSSGIGSSSSGGIAPDKTSNGALPSSSNNPNSPSSINLFDYPPSST